MAVLGYTSTSLGVGVDIGPGLLLGHFQRVRGSSIVACICIAYSFPPFGVLVETLKQVVSTLKLGCLSTR